jgi:Protein of unknown function (DUF1565)
MDFDCRIYHPMRCILAMSLAIFAGLPTWAFSNNTEIPQASPTSTDYPPPVSGRPYYVSTSGSDSNDGSVSRHWATITHASKVAGPGSVVHVAPGTYRLNSSTCIVSRKSGTAAKPITFISDKKWGAKIDGNGACKYTWHNYGDYVNVYGFDMTGSPALPGPRDDDPILFASEGGHTTFAYNHVHDLAANVSTATDFAPYKSGHYTNAPCSIHDNVFHDIGYSGSEPHANYAIYAVCSGSIYNNFISRIGSIGIHIWHAASNLYIYNNTISDIGNKNVQGIGILIGAGGSDAKTDAYFDVHDNTVSNTYYSIMAESEAPGTISPASVFKNNRLRGNQVDWYYNNNGSDSIKMSAVFKVSR